MALSGEALLVPPSRKRDCAWQQRREGEGAEAPEWRRVARSFCPVSNPPPYGCEVEAMTELMTVRLAELVNALRQKNAPTGDVCRGKLTHKETMSVKSS